MKIKYKRKGMDRMKSDIQIAQEAEMMHIKDVAATIGIPEEDLEFYGKYKAKLSDELWEEIKDRKDGIPLPPERERRPLPWDWDRPWQSLAGKPSSPSESLPLAPALALRAELPEAGMPRWFPWRI